MAKYKIIQWEDSRYLPLRYNNFAALNAIVHPLTPEPLVPFYGNIDEVLIEAKQLEAKLARQLTELGVHRVGSESASQVSYIDKLNFPFRFFRGERSTRFNIMPTRYRFKGESDPGEVTRQRGKFETRRAEQIKPYLQSHGLSTATIDHARAAARHYGCPSSFVDFTFNPDTAAFFAHPAFSDSERISGADIGILFSLGIEDFEQIFGGMAVWSIPEGGGRDIHYINLNKIWQIPYKSFNSTMRTLDDSMLTVQVPDRLVGRPISIRTRVVSAIPRIAAQEGIFIDACFEDADDWWSQVFLWSVLDFASRKWCFLRQDYGYENPESGVTAAKQFPPDDPELVELSRDFGNCP